MSACSQPFTTNILGPLLGDRSSCTGSQRGAFDSAIPPPRKRTRALPHKRMHRHEHHAAPHPAQRAQHSERQYLAKAFQRVGDLEGRRAGGLREAFSSVLQLYR